jgi:hypothetical protein
METLPQTTETITIAELTERVAAHAHKDLTLLIEALSTQKNLTASERKRLLALYLNALKQRLLRLHVLVHWAPKNARVTLVAENAFEVLDRHLRAFERTANDLYHLHRRLLWATMPMFDISGAIDVICRKSYDCLPGSIADVGRKRSDYRSNRKLLISNEKEEKDDDDDDENDVVRRKGIVDDEEGEEEEEEEIKMMARRRCLDAKHALIIEKFALRRFPNEEDDRFRVFEVCEKSGKVKCGVENMYEMKIVLDDAPAEDKVLWTCTSVDVLCGERSMAAKEEEIRYKANFDEREKLIYFATMRAKGDGTDKNPPKGLVGMHESMMDAVTILICAKTLAQAGVLKEEIISNNNTNISPLVRAWKRRGKVVAEIVKHKGEVEGCAVIFWNSRKRLDVKFEVDKRKITASVVGIKRPQRDSEKDIETIVLENTREQIYFDNGMISLINALELASKTATVSCLKSIRDILLSKKQNNPPTALPAAAKTKAKAPASKKRKASAVEEEADIQEEEEEDDDEENIENNDESLKGISLNELVIIDDDDDDGKDLKTTTAKTHFSMTFDRDELDAKNSDLATVSANISVNKYTGIVECTFKACPDSVIDPDDADDIIATGAFSKKLENSLASASERNDPTQVAKVFLDFLPEMRKIVKIFIVRKYLQQKMTKKSNNNDISALFAPYAIMQLKETLETTRLISGTNVASVCPVGKSGKFACVWEDGSTMIIECHKRRSSIERWRIEKCSEITRDGETLNTLSSSIVNNAKNTVSVKGSTKRAKTESGSIEKTSFSSSAVNIIKGAKPLSIEALAAVAIKAVEDAQK